MEDEARLEAWKRMALTVPMEFRVCQKQAALLSVCTLLRTWTAGAHVQVMRAELQTY